MRDPFTWSFPLGRMFGITIRVHILFPVVALGLILRVAYRAGMPYPGTWIDATMLMALLFFVGAAARVRPLLRRPAWWTATPARS